MIYRREHITDPDSGAGVRAEVRAGDAIYCDECLFERLMEAGTTLIEVGIEVRSEVGGAEVRADEGYFACSQIAGQEGCEVRTVISDPKSRHRRPANISDVFQQTSCVTRNQRGKALLRELGEDFARGSFHVIEHRGLRRNAACVV